MHIDLFKTNGSSPPSTTQTQTARGPENDDVWTVVDVARHRKMSRRQVLELTRKCGRLRSAHPIPVVRIHVRPSVPAKAVYCSGSRHWAVQVSNERSNSAQSKTNSSFWLRTAPVASSYAAAGVLRQSCAGERIQMEKQEKQSRKEKKVYAVQPREKMSPSLIDAYEDGELWPTRVYVSKRAAKRAAKEYNDTFEDDEPAIVRELVLIS
jgi:hypothetical protein